LGSTQQSIEHNLAVTSFRQNDRIVLQNDRFVLLFLLDRKERSIIFHTRKYQMVSHLAGILPQRFSEYGSEENVKRTLSNLGGVSEIVSIETSD